jgi:Family of unknown function (DUF6508)
MFGRWSRPGPKANGALSFPHFDVAPPVTAFVDAAYRFGWVRNDFDWVEWTRSEEMQSLRAPDGVEDANADQVARLLTVCIRQDRFVSGGLAGDYESGLLLRILRRVHELAVEAGGGAGSS